MTVRQLIELLARCPPDAEIFIPPGTFERDETGGMAMHKVRVVTSTSWTPAGSEHATPCVVLSKDELPTPDDDPPRGLPN